MSLLLLLSVRQLGFFGDGLERRGSASELFTKTRYKEPHNRGLERPFRVFMYEFPGWCLVSRQARAILRKPFGLMQK
jgi:hypothetical protein